MTKSITIILSVLICLSCTKEPGEYYFDFDKVEYYSLDIDDMELISTLDTPRNLTKIQKLESQVVFDYYPESMLDTTFISNLDKYDFTKIDIQSEYNSEINEIFRERFITQDEFTSCAKVYRDIFIFKKNNSISGISKICFECGDAYFIGTKAITTNFGNSGEYGDLSNIIEKIKL